MWFGIVATTLQEVRHIKIYLCYYFCSQVLLFNFTLYKLLQGQKIEQIVKQNHIVLGSHMSLRPQLPMEGLLLLILLEFTELTFLFAPNRNA